MQDTGRQRKEKKNTEEERTREREKTGTARKPKHRTRFDWGNVKAMLFVDVSDRPFGRVAEALRSDAIAFEKTRAMLRWLLRLGCSHIAHIV